jgi:hypothetical protein
MEMEGRGGEGTTESKMGEKLKEAEASALHGLGHKKGHAMAAGRRVHSHHTKTLHSFNSFISYSRHSALKSHIAELAEFALSQSLGFNVFFALLRHLLLLLLPYSKCPNGLMYV